MDVKIAKKNELLAVLLADAARFDISLGRQFDGVQSHVPR